MSVTRWEEKVGYCADITSVFLVVEGEQVAGHGIHNVLTTTYR